MNHFKSKTDLPSQSFSIEGYDNSKSKCQSLTKIAIFSQYKPVIFKVISIS